MDCNLYSWRFTVFKCTLLAYMCVNRYFFYSILKKFIFPKNYIRAFRSLPDFVFVYKKNKKHIMITIRMSRYSQSFLYKRANASFKRESIILIFLFFTSLSHFIYLSPCSLHTHMCLKTPKTI